MIKIVFDTDMQLVRRLFVKLYSVYATSCVTLFGLLPLNNLKLSCMQTSVLLVLFEALHSVEK